MPDTRAEDEAAERYAAHYREHNARLVAYARSLTGSAAVAEDLVAEAHFRVWRRIRAGHPVENVAAYLTTTVRNLAAGLGRAQREIAGDVAQLPEDPARAESAPQDPERRASHVDLISRLLKELPERWAKALWYAEVEDLPMEAVGAHIGASAGTTAVVLTRARERLRQAFLQSQPGVPVSEECEPYWKQMPTLVRATASARQTRTVLEHCEGCDDCRARMLALTEANTRLPLLLGPALLGIVLGGGAWFLPAVTGGAVATGGAHAGASAGASAAKAGAGVNAVVRTGSGARHVLPTARMRLLRHGLSPTKSIVVGSVAAVGVVAAATALALSSTAAASRTPAASSQATAQPTAATTTNNTAAGAAGTASSGAGAPAQSAVAATSTPTSAAPGAAATTPPASGAIVPAAAIAESSQTQAQVEAKTATSAGSAPGSPEGSPSQIQSASPSSTFGGTTVVQTPTATATSDSPTPSPIGSSPTPVPTPTPTPTSTSTTSCVIVIVTICVTW
jgi:RNA polymerase sigma factor (sigma-70 family)